MVIEDRVISHPSGLCMCTSTLMPWPFAQWNFSRVCNFQVLKILMDDILFVFFLISLGAVHKLFLLSKGRGSLKLPFLLSKNMSKWWWWWLWRVKNCRFWDNVIYGRPLNVMHLLGHLPKWKTSDIAQKPGWCAINYLYWRYYYPWTISNYVHFISLNNALCLFVCLICRPNDLTYRGLCK